MVRESEIFTLHKPALYTKGSRVRVPDLSVNKEVDRHTDERHGEALKS